eukprot:Ihof_evm1s904 gene=Ihof_evmTU1s904
MSLSTKQGSAKSTSYPTRPPPVAVNSNIASNQLRLLAEDGTTVGLFSLAGAQLLAEQQQKLLVEIRPAPNRVCKLMTDGELYRAKKEIDKNKPKPPSNHELRLTVAITSHDLAIKAKKLYSFLKEGSHVKIVIM